MEIIIKTILVGVGATIVMDIWAFILKLFDIKSLDYRFVGRWIGHFANGKFTHDKIFDSKPIQNEVFIGWLAHYLIGITFSILLVVIFGVEWLNHPTIFPALFVGFFTIVAPFFIMQPAFGLGIASSKLASPNVMRFRSLLTHLIFGFGLYISALTLSLF
ncbi:DUF2938 domain-containing protein [Empedobacter sp. GD03797]|uniref:DUF2938 domain-containing protein n=1 Tax=Empedobacter sp. GD03797 TaxID=2975382 RepID=UPI00244C0423|nr:DUF2938 domain-containing protein [Empedobacter sp. GD03797]MDH1881905.1 DUF2938 domain-containing protein [Empedobacter sp. GD03797]